MRGTTSIGLFFIALLCAACDKGEAEANDIVDDESGTETGAPERCEDQVTESACDGLSGTTNEEPWKCAWVDVRSSAGTCEGGTTEPQCVTLQYVGAGCAETFACGALAGPTAYIRDLGEAGVQVFLLETCEYQPEEWDRCRWDNPDFPPHEACTCSC